ncbi:MAG: ComEC/Rec2 family competence protein, partial [Bacteroidales bacterium]|nr:ComEC/Rec2 family competence protein [Bacteroidales bacterium]
YRSYRFIKPVWNLLSISTACQIATAPLVLYYFGNFPFFFLITNIAAIPLVTISLYILVFSMITCDIPIIGDIAGGMVQITVKILNWIIEYIGI